MHTCLCSSSHDRHVGEKKEMWSREHMTAHGGREPAAAAPPSSSSISRKAQEEGAVTSNSLVYLRCCTNHE